MSQYAPEVTAEAFAQARSCYGETEQWLASEEAAALTHAELEDQLGTRGRELLRRMFQGQLDLRALREQRRDDACAGYLTAKKPYLDYATALAQGWPIATGVIEGACRHLVKDRMDITGARRGLHGAEAILKLRALISNGDFDQYWHYHLRKEHERVHNARYRGSYVLAA